MHSKSLSCLSDDLMGAAAIQPEGALPIRLAIMRKAAFPKELIQPALRPLADGFESESKRILTVKCITDDSEHNFTLDRHRRTRLRFIRKPSVSDLFRNRLQESYFTLSGGPHFVCKF